MGPALVTFPHAGPDDRRVGASRCSWLRSDHRCV